MTLIDGDKIVTVQLYDDEYEELKEEQMSIIDSVNLYTTEGVTAADDVLAKIITEVERLPITDTAIKLVTEVINKYKKGELHESED